ncbi:MAG: sugar-binding domain-containing protein [Anaerostipes sp.]|nr:sugar-binding domain-containing protein [Anaerostipes sp.]
MKKIIDDKRLIYKCCSLYYNQRMTQEKICKKLGLSRATVSRLLEAGREVGIVQIQVVNPSDFNYGEMEQQLEELYGLKDVMIVEEQPLDTTYDRIERLSDTAFDYLRRRMKSGDFIGVTMGRSLLHITKTKKEYRENRDLLFVPMFGGVSQKRTGREDVQSNHIAVEFAKKFGGDYVQFLAPAVFSDEKVKKMFLKEDSMKYIYDYFSKLKIVIMGIGVPNISGTALVTEGYLDEDKLNEFVEKGAVGDASLQFYNIDGDTKPFDEFNKRVVGIQREQLCKVETRIGIGGGKKKAKAVIGAIASKSINVLVTDSECAIEILNYEKMRT